MTNRLCTSLSLRRVACVAIGITLAACGHRPTGFSMEEEATTTRGGFVGMIENGVFHDVLYNPESIALAFPGYIVGLDKGRHRDVGKGATLPEVVASDDEGLQEVKSRMKNDPKMHFVSHIVRNEGRPFGEGNCVLYSIYQEWGRTEPDNQAGEAPGLPCAGSSILYGNYVSAQADSPMALKALRTDLRRTIASKAAGAGYTHVVLAVMGWNTPQVEAVRNFNAIAAQIKQAAGTERFDPLFVGVTWPSVWTARWLDPAIKVISYRAKSNDADEVGTIWLSQLGDMLREEAPADAQLVAIGHSFGARAVFSAICSDTVWPQKSPSTRKWSTVIGWQPAFSINRFKDGGSRDGFKYEKACLDRADTIVLTASAYDAAVDTAFWADMAGSHDSWQRVCPPETGKLRLVERPNCVTVNPRAGEPAADLKIVRGAINYVDASAIVFFNQPNTGGGSHSDIYRSVHGRLNWHAMNPTGLPPPKLTQAQASR